MKKSICRARGDYVKVMAAIPYHVVESFKKHQSDKIAGGNFRSDGQRLFSFGMLLAHWKLGDGSKDDCIVFDYPVGHRVSVTTSRHMRALESLVERK